MRAWFGVGGFEHASFFVQTLIGKGRGIHRGVL